jgi:HPt (histidine-containing phosphotransfer) domain-containing protein
MRWDGRTEDAQMSQPPDSENDNAGSDNSGKDLQELLRKLWENNYPTVLERVRILRTAQLKFSADALDEQARENAEDAAHKLAGVLGTFGLPKGSILASKIEVLLAREGRRGAQQEQELRLWLDELEAIIASKQ